MVFFIFNMVTMKLKSFHEIYSYCMLKPYNIATPTRSPVSPSTLFSVSLCLHQYPHRSPPTSLLLAEAHFFKTEVCSVAYGAVTAQLCILTCCRGTCCLNRGQKPLPNMLVPHLLASSFHSMALSPQWLAEERLCLWKLQVGPKSGDLGGPH